MIGAACLYWFEAVQTAHHPQQLGEFSDAEIAARQVAVPRQGFLRHLAAVVAERLFHATALPTAPTRA